MCKIMIMSGLNPDNKELNWKFMNQMADIMSTGNNDGLGYSALDKNGRLFSEKWLFNHEAFDQRKHTHTKAFKIDRSKISKKKLDLMDFAELEEEKEYPSFQKYGTYGMINPDINAVILHARHATNTINYANVHPFVDTESQIALIHNGVISNHTVADQIRSTCDSERILNLYKEHLVDMDPTNIQKVIDNLKGWFACGVIAKDQEGRNIIDIFKTSASLACAFVKELDAMVFSTQLDDIRMACRMLNLNIISKSKSGVKEDCILRLDAMTGEAITTFKYKDTRHTYHNHSDSYWTRNKNTTWVAGRGYVDNDILFAEQKADYAKNRLEDKSNVIEGDFNKVEARQTEVQKQEEIELRKAGLTDAEVRQNEIRKRVAEHVELGGTPNDPIAIAIIESDVDELIIREKIRCDAEDMGMKNNWTDQGVINYENSLLKRKHLEPLTKKLDATSKIIKSYDPMNEEKAVVNDFYYSKEFNLWEKRKNGKH